MAALPGSGPDGGFFLLKGSFFSPQSPRARSGRGIGFNWLSMNWTNVEFHEIDLIGLRLYHSELDSNWLELDCIFEGP